VVSARSRFGEQFGDGVLYTSEGAHHSIAKAARIAGIAGTRVRTVATDGDLRLDPTALRAAIAHDLADGLRPMLVATTAGTTDTGAIDPLGACADVAAEHDAWFHVDAAYGGFFQLTDRGRQRLAGIERADSLTVDAHKSLFLPFGIGGLLVRDPGALVAAHEGRGAYMQDIDDDDLPHYLAMGPELTRPNRGVPVWLALQLHGVGAFRAALDRMLDLAEHAADRLAAIDGIQLVGQPPLSVVAFRGTDDEATRRIQAALDESQVVYVSSTTIHDRLHLRLALLSQRTTREIVDAAIDVVAGSARAGPRR
jgi:aromatic-L-amino-acid decarboxylase